MVSPNDRRHELLPSSVDAKTPHRTIWVDEAGFLSIIDQTHLPHALVCVRLIGLEAVCEAIRTMRVRGAGLIGVTAAYGMWQAALEAPVTTAGRFLAFMREAGRQLCRTRPTASTLAWAVKRQIHAIEDHVSGGRPPLDISELLREQAHRLADEDVAACKAIGQHGMRLLQALAAHKAPHEPLNILTHCNAGALAFVEHGSALAPIYAAFEAGMSIHVWVDETRPRNQGASLTAWELVMRRIPHTLIADNAGGHLMQHKQVDAVIVGADCVTRCGDVANKIGTYLKALAAKDTAVPFYVAFPASTFNMQLTEGLTSIPIEERSPEEIRTVAGIDTEGSMRTVRLCPAASPARNWGFDVTPARLITALITEQGVCEPNEASIAKAHQCWCH